MLLLILLLFIEVGKTNYVVNPEKLSLIEKFEYLNALVFDVVINQLFSGELCRDVACYVPTMSVLQELIPTPFSCKEKGYIIQICK